MKNKLFFLIAFIFISVNSFSQTDTNKIYNFVEQMPVYPGGDMAMSEYILSNIQYPKEALNNFIDGTVYIRFVVTRSGKVGEVQVFKSVDVLLDNEAVRVIKSLPDFAPGKQGDVAQNVWLMVPVKFSF